MKITFWEKLKDDLNLKAKARRRVGQANNPLWMRKRSTRSQILHGLASARKNINPIGFPVGKAVTLVKKLALSDQDLKALAKKLKQICGAGGDFKSCRAKTRLKINWSAPGREPKRDYRVLSCPIVFMQLQSFLC